MTLLQTRPFGVIKLMDGQAEMHSDPRAGATLSSDLGLIHCVMDCISWVRYDHASSSYFPKCTLMFSPMHTIHCDLYYFEFL